MPKTKCKLKHAKQRLYERFGINQLPAKYKKEFVESISNNRKIYHIIDTDIYYVWNKSNKQIVTFLTKEMLPKWLD